MMNQKEAVYQAICNVLGVQLGNAPEGTAVTLTSEQRASVNNILFEGFRGGHIAYDAEFAAKVADDKALRSYVSGLQSNWLRKDKRLNGNVKYEAKNPGSRTGSGDVVLKNMRLLLSTITDEADRKEIQAEIDARVAALKPTAPTLDVSSLPEHLRKFAK